MDAKIIKDLLANARKSFVDIAAECNLSSTAITERFTALKKSGIIINSTIQLNHKTLGQNAVCSVIIKVDPKGINQVIDHIKKMPFEIPLISPDVRHNINLIAGLKNFSDVGKLKEMIRRNNFVVDLKVENWIDVKNMPENLEICEAKRFKSSEIPFITAAKCENANVKLDSVDLQIIDKLAQDSMQPFARIAKEIGTSISTVSRKYKELIRNGTIKPNIQINLPKLGYIAAVIFTLTFASQSDTEVVIKKLMEIKDNTLIIKTSGAHDLLFFIMLRDLNQLLLAQNQIAKIQGLSSIEMQVFPASTRWPGTREYISTF